MISESGNQPTILVLRLSSFGDIALTVPVLKSLTTQNDVKVILITSGRVAPLFDEVRNLKVIPISNSFKLPNIIGVWKFTRKLKPLQYDYTADLHDVLRTKAIRLFLGKSKTKIIDKGRGMKKKLTRYPKEEFRRLKHTTERYAEVFHDLGFKLDLELPKPKFLESDNKNIINRKIRVGIAPLSQHAGKNYPLDLMEKVIEFIHKEYQLYLFASPKKIKRFKKWSEKFEITDTTQLSFKTQLVHINDLDLMLSMDSANGHIAANFGVPVVTIWGVTHPFLGFQPIGQPDKNQILLDQKKFPRVPTSVYGKIVPDGYSKAMRSISPESIVQRIKSVLTDLNLQ